MIVVRSNPYNNSYMYQNIQKRERIVTNKQACEEYQKIMQSKTKTKTFTFTK